MRPAGTIPEQRQARRFADYLLTQGIAARLAPTREGWTVWVIEEEALPRARAELASFCREPEAARFAVSREAERIRAEARAAQARRGAVAAALPPPQAQARWLSSLSSPTPLTWALLVLAAVAALLTGFGDLTSPMTQRLLPDPAAGLGAVAATEPWRLVTPALVHAGALHLLFTAVALPELGVRVEARAGTAALAAMLVGFGIFGNVVQYMSSGTGCLGLSAPTLGLFGFVVARRRADLPARDAEVVLLAAWAGACALGLVGPLGGAGHVAALLAGLALGAAVRFAGRR